MYIHGRVSFDRLILSNVKRNLPHRLAKMEGSLGIYFGGLVPRSAKGNDYR